MADHLTTANEWVYQTLGLHFFLSFQVNTQKTVNRKGMSSNGFIFPTILLNHRKGSSTASIFISISAYSFFSQRIVNQQKKLYSSLGHPSVRSFLKTLFNGVNISISLSHGRMLHDQNCQVPDKSIDTTFTIYIL